MNQDIANKSTTMLDEKKRLSPPYIPFLTFNNMITLLETEGIPVKFNRWFWGDKYPGGLGLQLMAGMRFLGLLGNDYTQPLLREIVKARGDNRKKLLTNMIRTSYSNAVDFSLLAGATADMIIEWFAKYGLSGNTDRKARSFFVNSCMTYEIPLSNSVKKTAHNKRASGTNEKTTVKEKIKLENKIETVRQNQSPSLNMAIEQLDLYKITLKDECELKLSSSKAIFELEKIDSELIENLVETMKKHQQRSQVTPKTSNKLSKMNN